MKGIEDDGIVKHRSADDLDDGYILYFLLHFNGFEIITFIVKLLMFSFDFGDDEIQPLAYNSEGKPLNTDLISINEEQNGDIYLHFMNKY